MDSARDLDIARDEFWRLTIRELFHEFAIRKRAKIAEFNRAISLAWHMAAFNNLTKQGKGKPGLKALKHYLWKDGQQAERQTPAQMRAVITALAAQHGGTLRSGKAAQRG